MKNTEGTEDTKATEGAEDAEDMEFMDRAFFLAERGRGRTTPNPLVGAVVVTPDGVVVGQGAHLEAGGPHAEVVALDVAGARARGATLYCTLEPCSHTGRTGPCVERIAAAGVARVVAAVTDPNPRVAGRGFEVLRARGIDVVDGIGAAEAARQNAAFFTWIAHGRPFVTLKSAVSSDGFVGRRDRRVELTGPAANRFLQRERAAFDAIAVGSGTDANGWYCQLRCNSRCQLRGNRFEHNREGASLLQGVRVVGDELGFERFSPPLAVTALLVDRLRQHTEMSHYRNTDVDQPADHVDD